MANANELLECSWGSIRLFASQVHTDSGRTQVVHELSSGDSHPVQDRGLRVRRVRVRLQFDDFPGAPAPLEAARALEAAKNTGQTAIFQHPVLGRYLASIGEFNSEVDESSVISAECEFIQEAADLGVLPTGPTTGGFSGEASVAAAAAALDGELAKVGQLKMSGEAASTLMARVPGGVSLSRVRGTVDLTAAEASAMVAGLANSVKANADSLATEAASIGSIPITTEFSFNGALAALRPIAEGTSQLVTPLTVRAVDVFAGSSGDPSTSLASVASSEAEAGLFTATTIDARIAVANWSEGEISTRQIMIDAARISTNIATMIEVGGLELDLALWPAFRAAIMLGDAVRAAAVAATSEVPSVFVMRIQERTALLPLAARVYGGAEAIDRARQIAALNDISTPGWLSPGDYLVPTRLTPAAF
jgi:hypothetical protein